MLRKLLFNFTAKLPCRVIGINGRPYLERYYVGKFLGLTFYLHRFLNGDGDREVHDHPWRMSISLILIGSYLEERLLYFMPCGWACRMRQMRPGKFNIITCHTFHRITKPSPETWTLFMHTRRIKGWGFLQIIETDDRTGSGLLYHQPYDLAASNDWHRHVKNGAQTERMPLWGGAKDAA